MAARGSKWQIAVHPVLIGLYSILTLLASNLNQVRPSAGVRSILLTLGGSLLLYALLSLVLRSSARGALLASLWLVLFFSYGHVYILIEGHSAFGFLYGKHRYLAALWLALFLLGSTLILKYARRPRSANEIMNLVSVVLLVFPLYQIGAFAYRTQRAEQGQVAASKPAPGGPVDPGGETPNIYYILLDGYSRADVMREVYGLDINPFLADLEGQGFVIPNCSQSNYGMTAFSMFASLNMDYLDSYADTIPIGSELDQVDTITMHDYLLHSRARQFLQERGYQMITFETGYWWLDIDDADLYIVGNDNPLTKYSPVAEVSNFEELYVRTTALRLLTELSPRLTGQVARRIRTPNQRHYEITSFALDQLSQVPGVPGKKFVYFHLVAPHTPFVFDRQGQFVDYDERNGVIPGFPDEVVYLNTRLSQIVRDILAAEKTPPVIILQSDHAWDPRYRMRILNAYYLPGGAVRQIDPGITPVNTFRMIFNAYFGANYPLLPNKSYFSIGEEFPEYGMLSRPYKFTPVEGSCVEK